ATARGWAKISGRSLEHFKMERGLAMINATIASNIKGAVNLVIEGVDKLCAAFEHIEDVDFYRIHTDFERFEESLHRKTLLDAAFAFMLSETTLVVSWALRALLTISLSVSALPTRKLPCVLLRVIVFTARSPRIQFQILSPLNKSQLPNLMKA